MKPKPSYEMYISLQFPTVVSPLVQGREVWSCTIVPSWDSGQCTAVKRGTSWNRGEGWREYVCSAETGVEWTSPAQVS